MQGKVYAFHALFIRVTPEVGCHTRRGFSKEPPGIFWRIKISLILPLFQSLQIKLTRAYKDDCFKCKFPSCFWATITKDVIGFRRRMFIDYCLCLWPQKYFFYSTSTLKDTAKCKLYARILKTNQKKWQLGVDLSRRNLYSRPQ